MTATEHRAPATASPHHPPTPLWAVCATTFVASIGTAVVWNGVAFIAEHDYRFSQARTLTLYLVMGSIYIVGALTTGPILRLFDRWMSPRTALAMILLAESAACSGVWFVRDDWMLWMVACLISVLSSWLWPIIESYLTAGRHGEQMRSAIGWWNLCWTGAVALTLVLMALLIRDHARMSIVLLGILHAVAIIGLIWFERRPGAHAEDIAEAAVQPEYPMLLTAARVLLPLSYLLNSAMTPLLPYLMNSLELAKEWQTPATSTWMWARIAAMTVLWQVQFWHGRWGVLLLGGAAMAAGFGLAVAGFSLGTMLVGLAIFGTGMGIIYYAALYYAMSVGRAAVDAGGMHEGLIGVGYTVGPAAGLIGLSAGHALQARGSEVSERAVVVGVVWFLVALAGAGVLKIYLQARRTRKTSHF
jgi:MFS family permease